MRSNRLWRWVVATVVIGLAALGYVLWIPVRHPNPSKVAALGVTRPVHGFRARPQATESSAATSPLKAVKQAAAATPGQTAVYTVAWKGLAKDSAAGLVVLALPNRRDADAARKDARTAYLSQAALEADGYGYAGALTLSAIPGASGATFETGTSPTTTATTPRTDAEVFSVGRVVAIATTEEKGTKAKTAVDALALAEYHHLQRIGTAPELAETTFPLVATVIYAGVTVAVLVLALLAPWAVAVLRRRRQAAWEAALRRERASRGSKVVKRRAGRTPTARSGSRRAAAKARTRR